jgi:hypothetical protein
MLDSFPPIKISRRWARKEKIKEARRRARGKEIPLKNNVRHKSKTTERFQKLISHIIGDIYEGHVYGAHKRIVPPEKLKGLRQAIQTRR